jgi:hypothetical protein
MESNALEKSIYMTSVRVGDLKPTLQSFIDSKRFVAVEWLLINACMIERPPCRGRAS